MQNTLIPQHNDTFWSSSLCKAITFLLFSIVPWSISSDSSLIQEPFPKAFILLFFSTKHNKPLLHPWFTLPRPHPLAPECPNDEPLKGPNLGEESLRFLWWNILIIKVESALASTRKGAEPIDAIASRYRGTSLCDEKERSMRRVCKRVEQSEEKSESVMKRWELSFRTENGEGKKRACSDGLSGAELKKMTTKWWHERVPLIV